ncbi:MAG: DUF3078 domain-containing protein [Marinifilaceae bacterium]
MRSIVAIILFLCSSPLFAQQLYPEIMENRASLRGMVTQKYRRAIQYPDKLILKKLPYSHINNTGLRYVIQNVEKEYAPAMHDAEIDKAVNTLLSYARNERMRELLEYMRKYTHKTAETEHSIAVLSNRIQQDSMKFKEDIDYLNMDEPYMSNIKSLVDYMRYDSTYNWLKKISRDSTFVTLLSSRDDSLKFWMNTGRDHYFRFWAPTRSGDTIGTWVQVLPENNGLRLYIDEGVYQANEIKLQPKKRPMVITNPMDDWYYNLRRMPIGKLKRRYWTYHSEVDLTLNQGKLANWASGGENSLSLISNVRYFWNYKRNNTSWENWMHYRFGFLKSGDEDIRKNEDRFELNSMLGQKAFKHWNYALQFNMRTQLFNSYDYPKDKDKVKVANFMSPGYFSLSLGLNYKPNNNHSLFISPITGNWNFVRDTANIPFKRYGIEVGKRSKRKAGAQIEVRNQFNNIFKVMNLRNEMKFFTSYEPEDREKGKGDNVEKKSPYTASWKVTIDLRINYFIKAQIYTETIYDENYSKKFQFRETLGLGLGFRF